MIRIALADEQPLFREGVKAALSSEQDLEILSSSGSASELLQSLRQQSVDLIILEITLPDKSGLDVLKELQLRKITTPTLVLTVHSEDRYALRSFRAGAMGYLTKSSTAKDLIKAIRRVVSGKKYVSEEFAEAVSYEHESSNWTHPHDKLSDREFQVMSLLAAGNSVRDIAQKLSLGTPTVYTYRQHIMRKLNINSISDMTRYAIEHQLIK
jgi:DNA-binding NarL/FixJ family response regulator